MGKWIKKLGGVPLTNVAKVIDSLVTSTNVHTNAPSINAVNNALGEVWETVYPVGSIYMNVSNIDPSVIFGGTWVRIKDRFLLSAGDTYTNGATGGAATHTLVTNNLPSHSHTYNKATEAASHVLTVQEIPSHSHNVGGMSINQGTGTTAIGVTESMQYPAATSSTGGGQGHTHGITDTTANTGNTGSATAVNHMPPYLVVNVWKRTA